MVPLQDDARPAAPPPGSGVPLGGPLVLPAPVAPVVPADVAGAWPDDATLASDEAVPVACAVPLSPALDARPRPAPLAAGTVLAGRYVLGERLGRGGMADVHPARDVVLDREVAVKVFHPSAAGPAATAHHRAETRLLARLSHPGLVTVFDAGTTALADEAEQDFLVMELVHGPTLAARIAQGPLPPGTAARVGAQVAEALAYVHDQRVVHRDVKPANILLPHVDRVAATETWARLADFGIARSGGEEDPGTPGEMLGTPSYLSPEQVAGDPLTAASDVYALGLVLVECLAGERPFPGDPVTAALARRHEAAPVPDHVGPHWAELFAAMTARDPADRPDAAEVAADLRAIRRSTPSA